MGSATAFGARRRLAALRVVSTMGIVGLVAGVPLLLVETHATPPLVEIRHLLVHPTQVQHVLAGRFSEGATSKLIWSIAWLAWGWFVVCAGVEIAARVRGRAPRLVPASKHVQSLVSCLVGASLAFGVPNRQASPLRFQVAAATASSSFSLPLIDAAHFKLRPKVPNVAGTELTVQTATSSARSDVPERLYTVKPGDTLWSISEQELSTPLSWRQIGAVNYGRPQADGGELTNDHWIRPGWVLVIPTPTNGPAAASATGASALMSTIPDLARPPLNPVPTTSVRPTATGTQSPETTDLSPGNSSDPEGRVGLPSDRNREPVGHVGRSGSHIPIAPIGYGLLGAGVVALLDRMRRSQQRHRPGGLRIALPAGDLQDLERGLRLAADPGSVDWVDLSLRLLSVSVRRGHFETPVVTGLLLRDNAVEIMLDPTSASIPPPPPFSLGPEARSWILAKSGQEIDQLQRDAQITGIDPPLPSLVTLGRDTSGILMVNIEAAGSVAISGPDADLLVETISVELATAKWSDQVDLVLVGFGEEVEGLERVSHASSLGVVTAKMKRRIQERAALLASVDRVSNHESRWRDGGDAWDLCIVVCSSRVCDGEQDSLEQLIEIVGKGSFGVAVVCGCDVVPAGWRVRAAAGRVSIEGTTLERAALSAQVVPPGFAQGVAGLVSIAAETAGVAPEKEPYRSLSVPIPEREPELPQLQIHGASTEDGVVVEDDGASEANVIVRVLGQVEITGAARQFTRAWAIELIVYLAVHPAGVSNEQWATALWPDRAMAPASLHSTASAARRSLGTSTTGEDHLPRSRGRLALGPHVRTDWDMFVDLSRSSRPTDWRQALEFIVGRPFDGLRSPDWVVLEGILATVEAGIVDLACRYAEHCLATFNSTGAEWAARQALRVSPYDERLYRVLLNASDAAGNPAGVESTMAELMHLVADDVEPFDAVHPETLALYRKLSRRSFASRSR